MRSRFENRFNMWIDQIGYNIIAWNRCVAHVHCFSLDLFTFYEKTILKWIESATFDVPRVKNAFIYSSSINCSMQKQHRFRSRIVSFFPELFIPIVVIDIVSILCFANKQKKRTKSIVSRDSTKCMHTRMRCSRLCNAIKLASIPFLRNVYHFLTLVLSHKHACSVSSPTISSRIFICAMLKYKHRALHLGLAASALAWQCVARIVFPFGSCNAQVFHIVLTRARAHTHIISMKRQKGCRPLKADLYMIPSHVCNTDYYFLSHRIVLFCFCLAILRSFFWFVCWFVILPHCVRFFACCRWILLFSFCMEWSPGSLIFAREWLRKRSASRCQCRLCVF